MGFVNLTPKPSSFLVGGVEFISNLVNWQVSDQSAFRNGLIATAGTCVLGSKPGQSLADYDRNRFKRGARTQLRVTFPSGRQKLHPRGTLWVISVAYAPEEEQLILELGCDLVMKNILERGEDLLSYTPIPLDPAQEDYANVAASLAANGEIVWANESNQLERATFFSGDAAGSVATSAFVSVRGVTALTVSPMALTQAIPDELQLSYQYPTSVRTEDNQGKVETETTESNYFLRYPATTFERFKLAPLEEIVAPPPIIIPPVIIVDSGCGNVPEPPPISPTIPVPEVPSTPPLACNYGYETKQVATYVSAKRREIRTTEYGGPSAQVSKSETLIYGPALEANSQYFADKYAFCVQTYASSCSPNGNCPMDGLDEILLGRQVTTYTYGSANEVIETVTSSYRPKLAAAQPTDWRSGINAGVPQDFNNDLDINSQYLHQAVIRGFSREGNVNVQKTRTFTSIASRGAGLGSQLDAYKGIETSETRRSSTTVTTDLRPDTANAATTAVENGERLLRIGGSIGGYNEPYGPYVVKEDLPVPLLLDSTAAVNEAVSNYGDYLSKFIRGDSRGLQIAEVLTEKVTDNWTPNAAFRYYDPATEKLMALRMDATTWAVSEEGCLFVTSAIWVNDLSGTATIPQNLIGNSTPVIDGENPSDGGGAYVPVLDDQGEVIGVEQVEIEVEDGTITNASYVFDVVVEFGFGAFPFCSGENGVRTPPPDPVNVNLEGTTVIWCTGSIVQPGALVSLDQDGSIPLQSVGKVVVDSQLVITEDLFAAASEGGAGEASTGGGSGEGY